MTGVVKGWCPGALRPMESGDGLVVRVRPHGGRLTAEQALALADLAETHGSGLIDLGSRAHVQLRGIRAASLSAIHAQLAALDLLDPDPEAEARRNILTTPVWQDDETLRLVALLEASLADAPSLPAKFGFAVDTGHVAILGDASADIRIERSQTGLILRADGMAMGEPVPPADAAHRAVDLARWFAARHGPHTRMARLIASGEVPPVRAAMAPLTGGPLAPGRTAAGLCLALPFGQMRAETLRHLAVAPLRLTPWRSVVAEGVDELPPRPGLISHPADPVLRVHACTGAPGCGQATVETRALARRLAALVPAGQILHVSGCAKGCAHPRPADLTLTGRDGRFDLILRGAPDAVPARTALTPDDVTDLMRGRLAP